MPNLRPPVELKNLENAPIRNYMLEEASKNDFDFPPVCELLIFCKPTIQC